MDDAPSTSTDPSSSSISTSIPSQYNPPRPPTPNPNFTPSNRIDPDNKFGMVQINKVSSEAFLLSMKEQVEQTRAHHRASLLSLRSHLTSPINHSPKSRTSREPWTSLSSLRVITSPQNLLRIPSDRLEREFTSSFSRESHSVERSVTILFSTDFASSLLLSSLLCTYRPVCLWSGDPTMDHIVAVFQGLYAVPQLRALMFPAILRPRSGYSGGSDVDRELSFLRQHSPGGKRTYDFEFIPLTDARSLLPFSLSQTTRHLRDRWSLRGDRYSGRFLSRLLQAERKHPYASLARPSCS